MKLSYTGIQRLGIAALLILTMTAVVCTVGLTRQVSRQRQAELVLHEAKWNRFASISQLFAEAGVQFGWESWNTEQEDPTTLLAIEHLDSIRTLTGELQEIELSASEKKALHDLIQLERRFRTAAYAYRATYFADPSRDDAKETVEEIHRIIRESVARARCLKDQAAEAVRQTRGTITSALDRSVLLMIISGGLILLAGVGISILLSRSLAKLVKAILGATEELASGNLTYRLNIAQGDILGRLARGVDQMAEQIEVTTGALQAAHDDLEAKVQKRTVDLAEANKCLQEEMAGRERTMQRQQKLNDLQQSLLGSGTLDEKLRRITDDVVDIFGADFCRIWITQPGDRCESGCMHAKVTEGPHVCRYRDRCLWLWASSGRYTHIDGEVHRRVPFGCYKIGRVASDQDSKFLTNEAPTDPRVHNNDWAKELGLVSFAGYQLRPPGGETIGVLALFAKHAISPDEDALLESLGNTVTQVVQKARAEEQVTQQNRFLNSVVESLTHPFVVIDAEDCSIVMANTAARRNGPPQAKTCHALTHRRDTPCEGADDPFPLAEVKRTGQPAVMEHTHYGIDGSPRAIEVYAYPLFDESGRVVHAIEYSLDVSERKQAERELKDYAEGMESSNAALQQASAEAEAAREGAERAKGDLEVAQRELVDASRQAGMAEIASGVLHNVGNVLNSVNVSASVATEKIRESRAPSLAKAAALMNEHAEDLGTFITEDEKGRQIPGYLTKLAEHLAGEQATVLDEIESLSQNIEHIKNIVSMQQSYAGVSGLVETVSLGDMVEDALKINVAAFDRHQVQVVREYGEVPPVALQRHKLLQILVNLLSNGKYALSARGGEDRRLTLRIGMCGEDHVRIEVADNGVGIRRESLTRIFAHGFTTKKERGGHSFGLHHSALLAKEMGGLLTAHSDGPDKGATFTLELPLEPAKVTK